MIGALLRSRLATRFRPMEFPGIGFPALMCVEIPCPLSRPGLGSAFNLTALGVVEGGFPFSLVVGSPEYTSQWVSFDPCSGESMLGRFQNFRVFLGIGRLLLNLPRLEMGECFIEGVEESDMGETSGLPRPLIPLSSLSMWSDSGGETSSG